MVPVLDYLMPILYTHLHLFILKEKEDEEASTSLQSDARPPDLFLPESTLEGVADDVRFDGVEARVEVEGNIRPRMQAAPTLEVHLEPSGGVVWLLRCPSGQRPTEILKVERKPRLMPLNLVSTKP